MIPASRDPTRSRKDHRRNRCSYGVGNIAAAAIAAAGAAIASAAIVAAAGNSVSCAAPGIVNPTIETESTTVDDKEITGATNPAVEAVVTNAIVARAAAL